MGAAPRMTLIGRIIRELAMVVRLLFNNISSTHTINVLLHNFIHSFTCMLTILTNIIYEKLTQRQTEFISLSLFVC